MGKLRTRRRRVGITGIGNSGKSVFLTSLLSHLENHDPVAVPLGLNGSATVRGFRLLPLAPDQACFEYANYRRTLVDHGQWPAKTRDAAHLACAFRRSDWRITDVELHFFDFPGERIADAPIIDHDYGGWSDAVLGPILYERATAELAHDFLAALDRKESGEVLIHSYKVALARLALAYRPLISPSTFLLGVDGRMASTGEAEAIAADRVAGLPGAELVPLPAAVREARPGLAAEFAVRYQAYREAVVEPVFSFLRQCHRLIVLVDIPGILMGGTGRYNDQRQILKQLFEVLDPQRGILAKLAGTATKTLLGDRFKPGGISRVAVVASKADLIYPADRGKQLMLLQDMAGRLAEDREGWRSALFVCSAVVSTVTVPGDHTLAGRLVFDEQGSRLPPTGEQLKYPVSEVPERWPAEWPPQAMRFPEVYPVVPRRMDLPPRQIGLEGIIEYLLDEDILE